MKKNLIVSVFFALFLMSPLNAAAYVGLCCGKCGGNMPLNIPGGGVPETHEFRFKLSPAFMKMDGLRDGASSVSGDDILGMPVMMGSPTGKFMAVPESMDMFMTNFSVGYSLTDDLFAGLMFMHQKKDMDMKFSPMMKSSTGVAGFTMESEGMGDTMLMTKYRLFTDDPLIPKSQVSFFLGLSLPTGSVNEKNSNHPVISRRTEFLPYSMQPGSGTFDPSLGILYQGSTSPFWWGANLMYTPRFYENDIGYNLGDELRLDLYSMYQLSYNFLLELQLNGSYKGKIEGEMDDVVSGNTGRATQGDGSSPYATPLWDPENYGGHQAFITGGVQWQPLPFHILNVQVTFPAYRHLNGPQLEEDYRILFTWYMELPTRASRRYSSNKKRESKLGF